MTLYITQYNVLCMFLVHLFAGFYSKYVSVGRSDLITSKKGLPRVGSSMNV